MFGRVGGFHFVWWTGGEQLQLLRHKVTFNGAKTPAYFHIRYYPKVAGKGRVINKIIYSSLFYRWQGPSWSFSWWRGIFINKLSSDSIT